VCVSHGQGKGCSGWTNCMIHSTAVMIWTMQQGIYAKEGTKKTTNAMRALCSSTQSSRLYVQTAQSKHNQFEPLALEQREPSHICDRCDIAHTLYQDKSDHTKMRQWFMEVRQTGTNPQQLLSTISLTLRHKLSLRLDGIPLCQTSTNTSTSSLMTSSLTGSAKLKSDSVRVYLRPVSTKITLLSCWPCKPTPPLFSSH